MHAHRTDLRVEVHDLKDDELERWLAALASGWRAADLSPEDRALCAYAEKLTGTPASMSEADVEGLRRHGFGDVEVHDLVQVTAFFNYINRVADAVHVDLEPEMPPYPG